MMANTQRGEVCGLFRTQARSMYFSGETVEMFLEKAPLAHIRAISDMIAFERDVRERRKKERLFRKARFPVIKSINEYDFSQVVFPEGYTKDNLLSLEFLEKAQDFVFYGKTGRGKTHLAVALGILCVKQGLTVRFFTTAELVLALGRCKKDGTLEPFMRDLGKADLVILDEFGYVPIDIDGARLLYQVIADCYERRSMLFTTNIEFSKWGTILGDEKLAAATIDRIVHHGRLVEFNGTSKRMDASLMLGHAEE